MTLSPETCARLKPVIKEALSDLGKIGETATNDKDALIALKDKLHASLVASELTREDLISLALPNITKAFINTLYEAAESLGDKPNAN